MIYTIDLHFQGVSKSIAAFLIESSEGPILIETGPHSTIEHLQTGIHEAGYDLTDIQHVLLSHIHLDHAGAAWALAEAGAMIHVHPMGYPHLADPSRLMHSARRIYQEEMDRLWGDMQAIDEELLVAIDDQQEIMIGELTFKAHYTPGHAIHHIAWQLDDILFTGDVAGVKIGQGLCVPPCPPPDINIETWQESINKIRRMKPSQLYLTHFGLIEQVKPHLDELEGRLLDWAAWMKPYYDNGTDQEVIRPLFQAYVAEELKNAGIDEEGLIQYESANPSWMSVAGLMRYWRKKAEQ